MCLSAIYWSRLDRVFYANTRKDAADIGFDDDLIYSEISKDLDQRKIEFIRILPDEAIKSFQSWQNKADKAPY